MNDTTENQDRSGETLVTLTSDIVTAFVGHNSVAIGDMGSLIGSVHAALAALSAAEPEAPAKREPAVSVRASIKPDYIVCLEDGRKLKTLKRHLAVHFQLTPEAYRKKWGLPKDYPMVAPSYAEQRKALAHKIGLGRKDRTPTKPAPTPGPRRKPKG